MTNAVFHVPEPYNEPVYGYEPGSKERAELKKELERQSAQTITIPLVIGGKKILTEQRQDIVMPCDHGHILASCCIAGEEHLQMAVDAALTAKAKWAALPFHQRAAIFLKAAALISGPYRYLINAATMLGQGKTAYQAEIDAPCELCDFLRFNAAYAEKIYGEQPKSSQGLWNRQTYRPLDGFVLAITPFNFTAIAGNLPSAPALMGNTVVWKPASTAVLSNYYLMKIFQEAGLPDGVINFVPSRGRDVSRIVVGHPKLAGVHFTGSTEVFQDIWAQVGTNIRRYESYPRLVGETGGKDFIFAHASASVPALVSAMLRGSYEYQGQKCSAASRAFIPASLWPQVETALKEGVKNLRQGDVQDFRTFLGAVIDRPSFEKLREAIDAAEASPDAALIFSGYDDSQGYFIAPTLIRALTPDYDSMKRELFGPVLSVYVYSDAALDETLELCDKSTPYALTGAIFAEEREAICHMEEALQSAAGNFYINDKPTGAVVGQQPFGGGRASGTNDKAGSALNLYRWVSVRTIKENFLPATEVSYPYMEEA